MYSTSQAGHPPLAVSAIKPWAQPAKEGCQRLLRLIAGSPPSDSSNMERMDTEESSDGVAIDAEGDCTMLGGGVFRFRIHEPTTLDTSYHQPLGPGPAPPIYSVYLWRYCTVY